MFLSQPWWALWPPVEQGCLTSCRGAPKFLAFAGALKSFSVLPCAWSRVNPSPSPKPRKPFTCIPLRASLYVHSFNTQNTCHHYSLLLLYLSATSRRRGQFRAGLWPGPLGEDLACLAGGAVLTFSGAAPGPHSAQQWTSTAPARPPSAWSWLCLDMRVCSALGPSVMP